MALPRLRTLRSGEWLALALLLGGVLVAIGPALWELILVSGGRLDAPFDLEWLEGGMLIEARRFWSGAGLYTAPEFEYVPLIYPPLYFVLLGPVMLFEPATQYLLARLISIVCLCATQYCLWRICAPRYGRATALVLAAVPLSFFAPSGFWLDNIRVDNLYLLLIFASMAVLLSEMSEGKRVVLSSLFFVAALFGKQSTLVLFPVLSIYWLLGGRVWRAVQQSALIAGFTAGIILMAQFFSDGYFWEYVWVIGRSHGYYYDDFGLALAAHIRQQYFSFPYLADLQWWVLAGIAVGLVIAGLHIRRRGDALRSWLEGRLWPERIQVDGFLGALGCGLLVMTALLATHVGSYWNNNLPGLYGFMLLALVSVRLVVFVGIALLRFGQARSARIRSALRFMGPRSLALLRWVAPVLLLSIAAQNYNTPLRQFMPLPALSAEMRTERQILNQLIERAGPALYPEQPPAAYISGVPEHYHGMALADLRKWPGYNLHSELTAFTQLDQFRFALSSREQLGYAGFTMRPIQEIGLDPLRLRFPVGADFSARFIYVRTARADADIARLREIVSELRVSTNLN